MAGLVADFKSHRPEGYEGKGDKYLPDIIKDLKHVIMKAPVSFATDDLYLFSREMGELANVIVEFAEDIYNDIGIWKSYEQYNYEFFNTPLPITLQPGVRSEGKELFKHRLCHLMWVLYSLIEPELILEPEHEDLILLAETIADFLEKRFKNIPHDSGIKTFLSRRNEYGWDVKNKLIWLGRHSYLFRNSFKNYVLEKYEGEVNIGIIDDFICQETICWSGLGVIDILAAALDITEKQRAQVRSWYERHLAYYRVLAVNGPLIEVMNLISDKPYLVRVGDFSSSFKPDQVVFGSLVPWNDEWYWSGGQKIVSGVPEKMTQQIKDYFFKDLYKVAYRFCGERLKKAREILSTCYLRFIEYHGDDLVIYPDGASMAADWKKRYPLIYGPISEETPFKKLKKPKAFRLPYSLQVERSRHGIGVYFIPEEGEETVLELNYIIGGLEKKGINLDEYEEEGIIRLIHSDEISPGFVKKLVQKYGDESIAAVFSIDRVKHKYYLDYLLRRYKGYYYRNRYPNVTLTGSVC